MKDVLFKKCVLCYGALCRKPRIRSFFSAMVETLGLFRNRPFLLSSILVDNQVQIKNKPYLPSSTLVETSGLAVTNLITLLHQCMW